ncbi:MAG: hypothetical protein II821_08915 [Treponema sp.]|nr:hypothetical protein [Treponema sp.]
MTGVYLNLILCSLSALALSAGVSFYIREKDSGYIRIYTLVFGIATFLTCLGYSIMGFTAELKYAFIPRLIGLFGLDSFLLLELAFLMTELKKKQGKQAVLLAFFGLYIFLDMLIFGKRNTLHYVRYDFHTSYENVGGGPFFFHYAYMILICITLTIHGVQWFRSKKIKRDKQFVLEIFVVNFTLLFAAFPDMARASFAVKYPTFSYCTALSLVYFSFYLAVKRHILFMPTVKNVSQEIFNSVDVPVLIFDMEGKLNLYNPCAGLKIHIDETKPQNLRSLFTLTDVETLRLLTKLKGGWSGEILSKIKATGTECSISTATKFDTAGDPFCIICTVLPVCRNSQES